MATPDKPLISRRISVRFETPTGGIYAGTNFPFGRVRLFRDRLEVSDWPTRSISWDQIEFLDLRNTGVEIVFTQNARESRLYLWSPFRLKETIARTVANENIPVSIKSQRKAWN